MRVLVACEFSGVVREAFRNRGHDAWSCDLIPSEDGSKFHYQGDVRSFLAAGPGWADMMIAHPPCTDLASSGARWFHEKFLDGRIWQAIDFCRWLLDSVSCPVALENPVGLLSTHLRKPDQIIQPWMFGHGETKATCLWLKRLPLLKPTKIVDGREARIHKMAPSANRGRERSRTYLGIANAMAEQWG